MPQPLFLKHCQNSSQETIALKDLEPWASTNDKLSRSAWRNRLDSTIPQQKSAVLQMIWRAFVQIIPFYTFYCVTLRHISLRCNTLRYITLHYVTFHYTAIHYVTLRDITSDVITLRYTALHYALRHISLHCTTLRYITYHYVTFHYTALGYVTFYIPLLYLRHISFY